MADRPATERAGTAYYVDSDGGDDDNDGTSPNSAWHSLDKVNSMIFSAGCRILFKAGTRYSGRLKPKGSGAAGNPIVVDQYGEGDLPRIDTEGSFEEALLLENQDYWEVNHLELTNHGPERSENRYGVRLSAWNYGIMKHIHLRNLYVHDVNATLVKKDRAEGHGILWESGGLKRSCFDDLLIEDCRVENVDRNGIGGYSKFKNRDTNWYPSRNIILRGNILEDIGGDGIKVVGCEGALVEWNVVRGAHLRCQDNACGIWAFASEDTAIQFNEVSGMKGTTDGQAFDSDFRSRNTVFQYNYSHDNEGGFMLVCAPDTKRGNQGTVVRYNISQNDGCRTFTMTGPVKNTQIYNNVIFIKEDLDIQVFVFSPWEDGQWPDGLSVCNNIFYAEGIGRYIHATRPSNPDGTYIGIPGFGPSTNIRFDYNVYFGNHVGQPAGSHNLTVDPGLCSPGSGAEGFDSLKGYQLAEESPCFHAGLKIDENGGRDFWGNSLPSDNNPDIGAHQMSQ
ncbi:MAG: right-handed parallel beta-helix repeat-containing protein [Anaerolineae bacterium]|nr:right-handed parallel beta-helix repeat-containing protein [Anaerolineae bacterium]